MSHVSERLLDSGTTLYFNRLLEVELPETAFRFALEERFGRGDLARARRDGRVRRRDGRLMDETRTAWEEVLAGFSFMRIELHEVAVTGARTYAAIRTPVV